MSANILFVTSRVTDEWIYTRFELNIYYMSDEWS